MQVTYGIGTSTEIAYYSYIYAKVDAEKYQKVTSFTRVATLSSIFLASVTGQVNVAIMCRNDELSWLFTKRSIAFHLIC